MTTPAIPELTARLRGLSQEMHDATSIEERDAIGGVLFSELFPHLPILLDVLERGQLTRDLLDRAWECGFLCGDGAEEDVTDQREQDVSALLVEARTVAPTLERT